MQIIWSNSRQCIQQFALNYIVSNIPRGLISIEMLRKIEEVCGKPIQDLFDYICGVSTGSLIAMMTGVFRAPLDECISLYRQCSTEMFNRSRIMGAGKLFTSQAYYDAALWEEILQ